MRTWLNGNLTDQPQVSAIDHGFTVGDGCFESLKTVDGEAFAPTRHLARLAWSAKQLRLPRLDLALARLAIDELLDGIPAEGIGRIRITYTAGPAPLGSERGPGPTTLAASWSNVEAPPPSTKIATVPWRRNEFGATTGVKSTSYAENVVALDEAHARNASEAIMANTAGFLCEGTGSNIFVVLGGQAYTPPLSSGCLAGITRALVLEWTDAQESDLDFSVLEEADEVFITSSTRDVQAVHEIDFDGRVFSLDPGQKTAQIAEIFDERAGADSDP